MSDLNDHQLIAGVNDLSREIMSFLSVGARDFEVQVCALLKVAAVIATARKANVTWDHLAAMMRDNLDMEMRMSREAFERTGVAG